MKKYISMLFMALLGVVVLASCDTETDEKPGGTAVERMAGQWDYKIAVVDENDNIVSWIKDSKDKTIDREGELDTYNTAANDADVMWFEDDYWGMKLKVDINYATGEFAAVPGSSYNYTKTSEQAPLERLEGRVLYGQAKNIHGAPVDSIYCYVKFGDDDEGKTYLYTGKRYSGFSE